MRLKKKVTKDVTFKHPLQFISEHRGALIVLAILFIERFVALYTLGYMYSLNSDDTSYVASGIYFAQTGTITMHEAFPSAQIMPGMTVLIGIVSLLFGEGAALWIVLKLLWITMGTLASWFIYRSVTLFCPKWCGVVAMLALLRADFVWMDNLILTETPFLLSLAAMVYFTLKMGKTQNYRSFFGCTIAYMAGLMLKANIALYPILALIYLLGVHYNKKLLMKQCVILACVVLCFVVPWSFRNYIHFHEFIPLTYGAGNPTLLGTYQGEGYPLDENLDYETNVEAVVKEKFAEFYEDNGTVNPKYERYIGLKRDAIKASYRQKVWANQHLGRMIYSYLVIKPQSMINSIFYWDTVFDEDADWLNRLQRLDIYLCILSIIASLILKKQRKQVLFLTMAYLVNMYIYAMTFAFDRYNASLMNLHFILIGIGFKLIFQLVEKGIQSVQQFERSKKENRIVND